jgi:hypothetical protein
VVLKIIVSRYNKLESPQKNEHTTPGHCRSVERPTNMADSDNAGDGGDKDNKKPSKRSPVHSHKTKKHNNEDTSANEPTPDADNVGETQPSATDHQTQENFTQNIDDVVKEAKTNNAVCKGYPFRRPQDCATEKAKDNGPITPPEKLLTDDATELTLSTRKLLTPDSRMYSVQHPVTHPSRKPNESKMSHADMRQPRRVEPSTCVTEDGNSAAPSQGNTAHVNDGVTGSSGNHAGSTDTTREEDEEAAGSGADENVTEKGDGEDETGEGSGNGKGE